MRIKFSILFLLNIFFATLFAQTQSMNIIPKPTSIDQHEGVFEFGKQTVLYAPVNNMEVKTVSDFLIEMLKPVTKVIYKPEGKKGKGKNKEIVFKIDPALRAQGEEAYNLTVTKNQILIEGANSKGLFYGVQTLRQLLPAEIEKEKVTKMKWSIPCLAITDHPRFSWRGFMLDVSRTFYNVDVVKKYLDVMALYKLNVFHFHLTDDQGWRIEIKKYPELTAPKATIFDARFNQPAERSGYFTQDQLRDLVKYAMDRNITIVPEIDLPGHSWPVIITYPELGSNNKLDPPYVFPFLASWGIWGSQFTPNILDPTNEKVYEFLDDVFTELTDIFPSKYIHFGGDEVRHVIWESEPHIKKFMVEKGFKNGKDLQSYFVSRVIKIIQSKGRLGMGWNDILEGDHKQLEGTAMMAWLGEKAITESAKGGFYVVGTPSSSVYFDITQADRNDGTLTDLGYQNINTLELVYKYDPTHGLTPDQERFVLGQQANMWPALALDVKDVNVQLFPRLLALAEGGWVASKDKNYDDFKNRLTNHYPRLDNLKVDYFKTGGYIFGTWKPADISTEYTSLTFDVTKKVYANGRAYAGFYYTNGEHFMDIARVDLLENGKVISSDMHQGLADKFRGTNKTKTFQYNLAVDKYNPKATYTIVAKVKGDKGTDSYGNFTFNLSPYIPFKVVESDK